MTDAVCIPGMSHTAVLGSRIARNSRKMATSLAVAAETLKTLHSKDYLTPPSSRDSKGDGKKQKEGGDKENKRAPGKDKTAPSKDKSTPDKITPGRDKTISAKDKTTLGKYKTTPSKDKTTPGKDKKTPSKVDKSPSVIHPTNGKIPAAGKTPPSCSSSKPNSKPFNPAIEDEKEKKEFFDSVEELNAKVKEIAKWVKDSRCTMMFTGAGISTSTGIPDFRSGMNTVLDTGPGKWELKDKSKKMDGVDWKEGKKKKSVSIVKALPSVTHMSIVKLHQEGLVSLTVSQNVDGLHRRSNVDPKLLAELHGNTNLERCKKCGHQYMRDYRTRSSKRVFNHETGRKCDDPKCRGDLLDSIVNFGEDLPEHELEKAELGAAKTALCIVLGSSLRVTPAADIPEDVKRGGGRLVICNLQRTPLHGLADVNVHALCDDFMTKLMAELQISIPVFKLNRRIRVAIQDKKGDKLSMSVTGLDPYDSSPYSFIKSITVLDEKNQKIFEGSEEPFHFTLPVGKSSVKVQLFFHGHYNEPSLHLDVPRSVDSALFNLSYQPGADLWETEIQPE